MDARCRSRRLLGMALVVVVAAAACGSGGHRASPSHHPSGTTAAATQRPSAECPVGAVTPGGTTGLSTYVPRASFPVALAWAPDGRLFFAERAGAVKVASAGRVSRFASVRTVTEEPGGVGSERGLLGLAISPTFATDHFVYAMYSSTDRDHQVIVRWTECAGVARDKTMLVSLPAGPDCCHKGGRLAFGPDGKLYATLGDEHSVRKPPGYVTAKRPVPQNTADPRGKILRYNPDGKVPADNPFGRNNPVWAAGLRNPFGLAFGSGGRLFVTSNGPTGDAGSPRTGYDLALTITKGEVSQWPYCYGYSHPITPYPSCRDRPEPDWSSERDTLVPTGATYVDSNGPAPFAGHFVFCTLNAGMRVFIAGSPHARVTQGPERCRLDITQGPDHALYFTDEAAIYRLG